MTNEQRLAILASHGDENAAEELDRVAIERREKGDRDMGAAMFAALRAKGDV